MQRGKHQSRRHLQGTKLESSHLLDGLDRIPHRPSEPTDFCGVHLTWQHWFRQYFPATQSEVKVRQESLKGYDDMGRRRCR